MALGMAVSYLIDYWMDFCTDIRGPQMMNRNNFGDSCNISSSAVVTLTFVVLSEIS